MIEKIKSIPKLIKNRQLLIQIKKRFYIDLNSNIKNTIFISGTGRSGTTWLSQIINYKNDFRYIFEPFYPGKVDFCYFFGWKQYLRLNEEYPLFYDAVKTILSGKARVHFINRHNRKLVNNKRLIKDVKTNLFMGWMAQRFTDLKSILIVRHPGAVINSYLKLGLDPNIKWYSNQHELMEDYLNDFSQELHSAVTRFDRILLMWCIENYVPLQQMRECPLNIKLVLYEDFCNKFEPTVKSVFQYLNIPYRDEVLATKKEASLTTRPFAAVLNDLDLTSAWKANIDEDKIKKIKKMTQLFKLDYLYEDLR
ncbi:MAG: sulfotransferase [Candidatus Lokiarchaeota archaeon]|nr:sulfotransferase [Candidatus Lokiarchaeota archaeon]